MKDIDDCLFIDGASKIVDFFGRKSNALLILGKGFDPRATIFLDLIKDFVADLYVKVIDYGDKGINENELNMSRSEENTQKITEMCERNSIPFEIKQVPQYRLRGNDKNLIINESIRKEFTREYLSGYDNIIVDISAMPRAVMFSLIKRILLNSGQGQKHYVVVCENSEWDENITPVIVEDSAEYLQGFNTFGMTQDNRNERTIWLPMLGMYEENAFSVIYDFLDPVDEICPVVPFPATDIHRGEVILRNYGEQLFRDRGLDKRNIIYVPESHPILTCQKLYKTVLYYEKALNTNEQGNKYAFSSQSSKLIDLGMLLAIVRLEENEIKTGIVVVDHQGYSSNNGYDEANNHMYCLCMDDKKFGW